MKPAFIRTPGPVPATPPTTFATALRRYRKRCHYSQAGLARMAGFNHSYISRLESGNRETPTREAIDALATAMVLDAADRDALMIAGGYVPAGYDADLLALTRLSDTGKHAVRAVMAVALGEGGEG